MATVSCGTGQGASATSPQDAGNDSAVVDDSGVVNDLIVGLKDGKVQGDMAGEARRFLNIPYAKPPLGSLRWKAPVPNDPWTGVRHETQFVQGCAQLADQGAPASSNEDCLYLNVWSAEPAPVRAPVMVWFHGGGNFSGGTGIPIPTTTQLWYDGQFFASRHGVVVVTIQYRLGPLGFFAHPDLAAEGSPTGNQGLYDQRLALQWVRDNIAQFGGDPGNVTIFGESAGSLDVCYHMVSPGSRGLFHRAISESGGCTLGNPAPESPAADVASQMVAYGAAVGCAAGAGQLACTRAVSVDTLMSNSMQPAPGDGTTQMASWSFAVVVDGSNGFLPDAPRTLFNMGAIAKVPYLLGSNNDEGTTFLIRATQLTSEADYTADLQMRFGSSAGQVAALYPSSNFGGDVNAARARVVGDSTVVCSTHDTARRAATAGLKVFMYNFNMPWSIAPTVLFAGHGSEVSDVFDSPYLPSPDAQSQTVADAMNAYWSRFAATGDPSGPGAPAQWPAFSAAVDKRQQLDPGWEQLDDFRTTECAFWRTYYGAN
jgi:para-nitrobenzyl esterase